MKNHFFVNVLINLPLDKYYTYKVNKKHKRKIEIGSIVSIPFGNNNEIIKGVVISIVSDFKSNYIIKKISDNQNKNIIFTKKQIEFFKWAEEYYLLNLSKIFHTIVPNNILESINNSNINNQKNNKKIDNNLKELNKFDTYLIKDLSTNYTDLIYRYIKNDKNSKNQFLILTPNIYYSFEVYKRLKLIYKNQCCVYNSKISLKEKQKNWINIINNKIRIIIGVKSAIFLPFNNLKLSIVLNEHENLYKENEKKLRYNARDCSVMLTKIYNSKTILVSETPSIESYYNVQKRKYGYINNTKNIKKINLKKVLTINTVEKKIKNKIYGLISDDLFKKIKKNINQKSKCIIYTPSSKNINLINNQLIKYDKNYKILLFNKNNLKNKKSIFNIIDNINKYDIIIGNQTVLSSLNIKNCKLIALIDTDKISNKPYYKANEKYFQILSSIIQRINSNSQKLIIQTNNSTNQIFKQSLSLNNKGFYDNEIKERKIYKYSPYYRIIRIEITTNKNASEINNIDEFYKKFKLKFKLFDISNIGNINIDNKYKYIIELKLPQNKLLKSNKNKVQKFIKIIKKEKLFKEMNFIIDIDP